MRNTRNTVQRTLVLNALCELNHPNADEIYEKIITTKPNISRGTVYRNLNLLADNNEIRRISVCGGADRFDADIRKHCHFVCLECLKVFDIDAEYPEGLLENIKNSNGYFVDGYDIIYKGICQNCMYNRVNSEQI